MTIKNKLSNKNTSTFRNRKKNNTKKYNKTNKKYKKTQHKSNKKYNNKKTQRKKYKNKMKGGFRIPSFFGEKETPKEKEQRVFINTRINKLYLRDIFSKLGDEEKNYCMSLGDRTLIEGFLKASPREREKILKLSKKNDEGVAAEVELKAIIDGQSPSGKKETPYPVDQNRQYSAFTNADAVAAPVTTNAYAVAAPTAPDGSAVTAPVTTNANKLEGSIML